MANDKWTELNRFRLLGRSGLRVSPLCLGTMTFGPEWGWGCDKEESQKIFNYYVDRGGNFIDTANFYTGGTSETYLGDFMASKRDQLVLATKYTLNMRPGDPNGGGNHRKSMIQSLEASLKRLKTDYIDLYWVHMWDQLTPIDEVMRGLDDLIRSGKVLYIGISDMPAWMIAKANTLAELKSWTPFIGLQIEYSLIERTIEREFIALAKELGMGITPWSPLAGGILTGKYQPEAPPLDESLPNRKDFLANRLVERNFAIVKEVQRIAESIGRTPSQVSINWLFQRDGVISPIIGARRLDQLEDNLGALDFTLSQEDMGKLDDVSQIELGFPHDFLSIPMIKDHMSGGTKIE